LLDETIKAAKCSALQVLKRSRKDFKQPIKKIEITSGDFHNNNVLWICTVDEKKCLLKNQQISNRRYGGKWFFRD